MDNLRILILRTALLALAAGLSSCAHYKNGNHVLVSVEDQRMVLMNYGEPVKSYPVSTSKYGLGDKPGSYRTPVGHMSIYQKIGGGAPHGAVFKGRRPTGEIVRPNSPGRDPIITRIMWLEGEERSTKNARRRFIYIHGTPEERNIGRPVSYGCIRMTSRDVVDLYRRVEAETSVYVTRRELRLAEVPTQDTEFYQMVASRTANETEVFSPEYMDRELMAAAEPYSDESEERVRLVRPGGLLGIRGKND
ncbi:MAG: L,D-transpeptidase [Verrucomicrobiota bacterium]